MLMQHVARAPLSQVANRQPVFSATSAMQPTRQKTYSWEAQVTRLPLDMQPVVRTFGELVMSESDAFLVSTALPDRIEQLPRYPLPSNPAQMKLAEKLVKKLKTLGLEASLDPHYNVIGKLASNLPPEKRATVPVLALTAHLDTTFEQSGKNVKPQIHFNYGGNTLTIASRNAKGEAVMLDPAESPALKSRMGEHIITASGDTLLGADAKAGIAEILEALRVLQEHNRKNPKAPWYHPDLRIVFPVDEETSMLGARRVDLQTLGADYAIDLDDTDPGRINTASYTGQDIAIKIKAQSAHPAEKAHIRMGNPVRIMSEIGTSLPNNQLLENKSGAMQGYLLLDHMQADAHQAHMLILSRDLDIMSLNRRTNRVLKSLKTIRKKYEAQNSPVSIEWSAKTMYHNPGIDRRSDFVRHLVQSARKTNIQPQLTEFRACADAAIWSERNLPTVNLGCGWQNAHQLNEWVSAQDLYRMSRYLLNIITDWPEHGPKKSASAKPKTFKPLAWPTIINQSPGWAFETYTTANNGNS